MYNSGCAILPNSPQTSTTAETYQSCASKCRENSVPTYGSCTHFHYRPGSGNCFFRYGQTEIKNAVSLWDTDMTCGIILSKRTLFFF